jgi:DNA-binding XRE family transcriptional regulator
MNVRKPDYEALIERLEDIIDVATLDELEARLAAGGNAALADYLSAELVERLVAGESPVRIWREHRGLSVRALAAAAGLAPSYLSEIEAGRKPGSLAAMAKIARTLKVALEDLVPASGKPATPRPTLTPRRARGSRRHAPRRRG